MLDRGRYEETQNEKAVVYCTVLHERKITITTNTNHLGILNINVVYPKLRNNDYYETLLIMYSVLCSRISEKMQADKAIRHYFCVCSVIPRLKSCLIK